MLQAIPFPSDLYERGTPDETQAMIRDVRSRIEAFQDRWDIPQVEQFVAADYELVHASLDWLRETQILTGNRFLEWGCGFAAITLLAQSLGFDSIGIESESVLLQHGCETLSSWSSRLGCASEPELIQGNFLPEGADALADDPTLPSLGHLASSAYGQIGLEVSDFAVIYSYPWPGEDDFHELVFDRFASPGAILVHFRGPNDVRAWRKRTQ